MEPVEYLDHLERKWAEHGRRACSFDRLARRHEELAELFEEVDRWELGAVERTVAGHYRLMAAIERECCGGTVDSQV